MVQILAEAALGVLEGAQGPAWRSHIDQLGKLQMEVKD